MVKSKKSTLSKKTNKSDSEPLDNNTEEVDNVTEKTSTEDPVDDSARENGVDTGTKKKVKGKATKKESSENDEERCTSPPHENGDAAANEKKKPERKTPKKKAASKSAVEPARKSSRTPKPVATEIKKANEKDSGKPTKKRAASKSPAKPAKKVKDDEDYEVEEIVGMRTKNGKREFKIRWKGYQPNDDSWEPEKHLSCEALIEAYINEHKDEVEVEEKKSPEKKARTSVKSKKGKKSKAK